MFQYVGKWHLKVRVYMYKIQLEDNNKDVYSSFTACYRQEKRLKKSNTNFCKYNRMKIYLTRQFPKMRLFNRQHYQFYRENG